MTAPLVEVRGVSMRFPGVNALSAVDFEVRPGEVHALIGENGAGKSTLVNILGGALRGYEGDLAVDGRPRHFGSPRDAIAAGIAIIPQELQLVRPLSVAENILLGHEPKSGIVVDQRTRDRTARERLQAVGAGAIDVSRRLDELETADRQLVAIARALSLEARCLVMDEPTAALGADAARRLEAVVARLAASGVGVVYISHHLGEVVRLADRITVLRDGVRVAALDRGSATEAELIRLMVGRDLEPNRLSPVADGAPVRLAVENLSVPDDHAPSGWRIREVSFTVRAGEIVGLAGLKGAGRTDLLLALVGGLPRPATGRITIDGRRYQPMNPAKALERGLVLLPEERKAAGIFPRLGLDHNITIGRLQSLGRAGWIDGGRERALVDSTITDLGISAPRRDAPIETLSGGNQQKALLGRCLVALPNVLLLDEPTRGIDLGAKADLARELAALAARGYGIVLCSSEMEELLGQCHRIVVMRGGRVTATFDRAEATEEKVVAAATGGSIQKPAGSPANPSPGDGGRRGWRARLASHGSLVGLVAVLLLAIVTSPIRGGRPVFLDLGNLTDVLRQVSEKGILAVGMTAVVIAGGIDLSVGSVLAMGATFAAWLLMNGTGLGLTLILVTAMSAVWGFLNGVVIAKGRFPAFVATLATMGAIRGAARLLSGGAAIPLGFGPGGAPESVRALAAPLVPYVPMPAVIFGLTALAMHLLLARTRSGRYLYAIGDNETAARLAGVRVTWHQASVYLISAMLAGLAGVIHCAQLEQGNPNDGVAYELDAIAAVVIGGTSLSGGTGSIGGTLVGVLIIGIINNSLGLNNVDANLQLIIKGAIILGAVWFQRRKAA